MCANVRKMCIVCCYFKYCKLYIFVCFLDNCPISLNTIGNLPPAQGNQPPGKMRHRTIANSLPGYDQYKTIVITYEIPSGVQGTEHPNPGERFQGVTRVAYLPDSPEGKKILELLKKAFDAKLIFTVGMSQSTKKDNTVVWNRGISHKTTTESGRYALLHHCDSRYLATLCDYYHLLLTKIWIHIATSYIIAIAQ